MSWNEPGGPGNKDPWGGRGPDQGPPDLDEVFRKFQNKLGGLFGGRRGGDRSGAGGGGGGMGGIAMVIVLVVAAWVVYDSTHIIDEAERGVVLRFGQYADTLQPGLNFRFPRPVEEVFRVNVLEVRRIDIGATKAESLMLTEDENIIDVKFTVQYQVKNARDYLFNVLEPDVTLRQITESSVREVVGKSKTDYVLTEGRDVIAAKAKELIQEILDFYGTGLRINNANMQNAQPPDQVQEAFADAVKAREDEERYKNEAEAYSRDLFGKAKGAEQRVRLDAEAYKGRIIERATGEADRFLALLEEYEAAPEVTRERLYLETMEKVYARSSKVMTDVEGSNNLLYLPLDRLVEQARGRESLAEPAPGGAGPARGTGPQRGVTTERDLVRSRGVR